MTGPSGITAGTAGTARVGRTGSARAVRPDAGRPGGPDAPRSGGPRPDGGRPGGGSADAGRVDHGRADAPDARLVPGARGWPRVVAVALLVLAVPAALLPLLPVVDPPVLVRVGGIGAVLGAAFALLTTWRRWGAALTLATLVVGYLGGGMIAVAPPWRAGGSLGASLMALLGGIVTSWKDALTLTPPIGEVPGVLVAPWLLSFTGTALVVVLGLRGRAWAPAAGLVPPVVLAAALVLGDARAVLPAVLGVAIGAVGIVAAGLLRGARMQRPVSLAVLLVVPIVAGLATPWVLAPLDRLVVRDQVVPPFDPAAYESPLATFRKFVKADDDVELEISGDTAADVAGTRLRTAVMDSYDGVVWTTSVSSGTGGQSSGDFRRVAGERAVLGDPVALDVTVRGLTGVWLPTVGSMRRFDATPELRDALRYNDATTSAVLVDGLSEGDTYRIEAAVEPAVEDAALADVGVADVDLGPVTGVPEVVGLVAREWVGAADTPIEVARALEQRLAGSGYYSDGLTEGTPAGHGADRMTTLLESDLMVGNGEQYASAMALMARELGLPARVVMGFDVPADGEAGPDGSFPVHGRDVDAWVEIAFDGVGWVPFYPTPDKSRTPDTSEVVTDPENQPLVTQPRPTQPPPTQAPTAEPNDVRPQDRPDPEPEDAGAGWVWAVAGATAGGLLLLAVPFLVVLAAKAARARARRSDPDPR
ncbi:MAG TPA: hypothetical protein DHV14_10045, partial [Micrococcales bacterium]|uniref:transglutaminase-like domain-containing protein n=1 Tax=Miniimonas arenae TaxID=676201 RepID=UPI000ED0073E